MRRARQASQNCEPAAAQPLVQSELQLVGIRCCTASGAVRAAVGRNTLHSLWCCGRTVECDREIVHSHIATTGVIGNSEEPCFLKRFSPVV